jgi:hypothetical protein
MLLKTIPTWLFLPSLGSAMLLGTASLLCGQKEPAQKTQLDIVTVLPQVHVVIEVHTADEPIVVPYCGETDLGVPILCFRGSRANLEVQTAQGWQPVKLRTTHGVVGGPPSARFRYRLVPRQSKAYFVFQFSGRWFDVEPGQQLRVVLDAWPDEGAVNNVRPAGLISPPFECPQSGTGQ